MDQRQCSNKINCQTSIGLVFAEDGKIILRMDDHKYKLTGGHLEEKDNCFEDTLKREFIEELNVEIQDIYQLKKILLNMHRLE